MKDSILKVLDAPESENNAQCGARF
jgi:hypothetical protein